MNDWLLVAVCVSGGVARDGKISDSLLVPEIEIVAGMDQVEDKVEDYNLKSFTFFLIPSITKSFFCISISTSLSLISDFSSSLFFLFNSNSKSCTSCPYLVLVWLDLVGCLQDNRFSNIRDSNSSAIAFI